MTAENEARGRSNRTKGNTWMRQCTRALREFRVPGYPPGWPHAEVIHAPGRSDITGCGDIAVECKDERGWDRLSAAVGQAAEDADNRGLPTFVVWRKRPGYADPMQGWCVQPAHQFWADRKELERLEAIEQEFAAWRAGLAAAQQAREAAG